MTPRTYRALKIGAEIAVPLLILAFTAELFMGTPGLGHELNYVESFGLNDQMYAIAVATGFLGLAIHFLFSALEGRALRWHPSQRARV